MIAKDSIRRSAMALASLLICDASDAEEAAPDPFKIAVGAYHWFNLPRHDGDLTYGTEGLPDTYRWEAILDAAHRIGEDDTLGFHADVRYRESGPLRAFMSSPFWTWEVYGQWESDAGTFKGGQIWSRYGLDWDGSWYGNVQYFDGLKLDPDFGVAWEKTWAPGSENLSVATFAQFFFAEDKVNGSLVGGDAESADHYRERNTAIVRVVPQWKLDSNSSIALGLSGRLGEIDRRGADEHHLAGAALDLTYAMGNFKVYAEADSGIGTPNPVHYVTGGASDRARRYMAGTDYTFDPPSFIGSTTLRYTFSRGEYEHPGGTQDLRLVGLTTQLAPWLTFYAEYVNWDVRADGAPSVKYEDGFQFILYWRIDQSTFSFLSR